MLNGLRVPSGIAAVTDPPRNTAEGDGYAKPMGLGAVSLTQPASTSVGVGRLCCLCFSLNNVISGTRERVHSYL
jgi:hypothetical protein